MVFCINLIHSTYSIVIRKWLHPARVDDWLCNWSRAFGAKEMESVFSFPRSRARLWWVREGLLEDHLVHLSDSVLSLLRLSPRDPTSTGEPVRVNLTRLGLVSRVALQADSAAAEQIESLAETASFCNSNISLMLCVNQCIHVTCWSSADGLAWQWRSQRSTWQQDTARVQTDRRVFSSASSLLHHISPMVNTSYCYLLASMNSHSPFFFSDSHFCPPLKAPLSSSMTFHWFPYFFMKPH